MHGRASFIVEVHSDNGPPSWRALARHLSSSVDLPSKTGTVPNQGRICPRVTKIRRLEPSHGRWAVIDFDGVP